MAQPGGRRRRIGIHFQGRFRRRSRPYRGSSKTGGYEPSRCACRSRRDNLRPWRSTRCQPPSTRIIHLHGVFCWATKRPTPNRRSF
jgi:hypothetical protein